MVASGKGFAIIIRNTAPYAQAADMQRRMTYVARYRQNALTLLLRDAFAFGDSAAVFVCCLSPLAIRTARSRSQDCLRS